MIRPLTDVVAQRSRANLRYRARVQAVHVSLGRNRSASHSLCNFPEVLSASRAEILLPRLEECRPESIGHPFSHVNGCITLRRLSVRHDCHDQTQATRVQATLLQRNLDFRLAVKVRPIKDNRFLWKPCQPRAVTHFQFRHDARGFGSASNCAALRLSPLLHRVRLRIKLRTSRLLPR